MQSVLNLSYNGVPDEILIKLLKDGMDDKVGCLMDWGNELALWTAINQAGHVSGARLQRNAPRYSRALGFQGRNWGHSDEVAEGRPVDPNDDPMSSAYTGRNAYSGGQLS